MCLKRDAQGSEYKTMLCIKNMVTGTEVCLNILGVSKPVEKQKSTRTMSLNRKNIEVVYGAKEVTSHVHIKPVMV